MTQCLEFLQALASKGQTISFYLTLGSTFSFNLVTRRKATSPSEIVTQTKKPLPSTVEWIRKRMPNFNEKKIFLLESPPYDFTRFYGILNGPCVAQAVLQSSP